MKDAAQKEERDRKKKENQEKKLREQRDRAAADEARKQAMEQEESKRLGGRMLIIMQKAQADDTQHNYTLSGLELGAARTLILSKIMAYNSTIKSLHLCRKAIEDKEGQDIARMLLTNKVLRKLELESNILGL